MVTHLMRDPMYKQLNGLLRGQIRSGEFKVGDRFLTERQVAERFGVSRVTANKALSNLVSEGILKFKKGTGTFVQGGILDYDVRSLVSFTERAAAAGRLPSTRVLSFRLSTAAKANEGPGIPWPGGPGEPAYYMERVRLADDLPLILERRWVIAHYCPDLDETMLEGSLYALWADRYRLDITGADQIIRAVVIRRKDAGLLEVRPGSAGLLVVSVGYLSGGVPLWFERTLYRGDAYEFVNRLGPLATARPAAGVLRELGALEKSHESTG